MHRLLIDAHYNTWLSLLDVKLDIELEKLRAREWTFENFKFATAVSVMSSSRIEGETLEVDSYVKHKMLDVEYLPNLTEKPNDLFEAYEFAKEHRLSRDHFQEVHAIATQHLLPDTQRGQIRKGNMLIMEQQTQRVEYEAASAQLVKKEYERFWDELDDLIKADLQTEEVFIMLR